MGFSILPLLVVPWGVPFSEWVDCSDASMHGYAVRKKRCSMDTSRALGVWSDRWRFRWQAGEDPRARAVGRLEGHPMYETQRFERAAAGSQSERAPARACAFAAESGPWVQRGEVGLELNLHFPKMPLSVTPEVEWQLVQARRYTRAEPIHILEGRAMLFGLGWMRQADAGRRRGSHPRPPAPQNAAA